MANTGFSKILGHRKDGRPIYLIAGAEPYTFPFDVPDDLTALSAEQLGELRGQVAEHARELLADENAGAQALSETHALLSQIREREAELAAAADTRAQLSAALDDDSDDGEPGDSGDGDSDDDVAAGDGGDGDGGSGDNAGLTADRSRAPGVADAARRGGPPQPPPDPEPEPYATMVAAADVPGFSSGQGLTNFGQAALAVENRLSSYAVGGGGKRRGGKRVSADVKRDIEATLSKATGHIIRLKNPTRHGAVRFNRQFPEDQRVSDGERGYDKLLKVADERRLPGGNLIESAKRLVESGRALTAAAGWCAASEVIYQLCELESMDGILDLPELQAPRGGFNIPDDGGPDFSVIWNGIGNAGDTHLSEYDVEQDTAKVCFDIPCPEFVDNRLGVDYFCLTGSLLQRRGYPEVIERFSSGSMVALAHKINQGVIGDIVTASGAATTISADSGGDDAAAALLSAVELGIVDMKYRNRMPFAATLEVVLPMWVLVVIRAALARRSGVGLLGISDAQILEWFAIRGAMPRFVYDWQDALAGLAGGPGAASALTELPSTVDFLVYPAGTFTKAVADVVSLDTIYDAASLQNNEYTAVFAEDGWAVLQTCPDVQRYTVPVDVSGCVGCIAEGTS